MQLSTLTPDGWQDYELIDSGSGMKLERFGQWTLARPEPQALWSPDLGEDEWRDRADAVFLKAAGNDEKGKWELRQGMPGQWTVRYGYRDMDLRMRLGLTSFKHVGLFPEQAVNWDYIYDSVGRIGGRPQVLNLFAYTGGATLAAIAAGAEVTHVDSVRQTVGWSRENMELSGLSGARWIVEDAMKFVRREMRRGRRYDGIILDPPSYGRGPEGEKWVLEDDIAEMLDHCGRLLADSGSFLVLNLYSMGLSALLASTLVRQKFRQHYAEETGELYVADSFGKKLPLGVFLRFFAE